MSISQVCLSNHLHPHDTLLKVQTYIHDRQTTTSTCRSRTHTVSQNLSGSDVWIDLWRLISIKWFVCKPTHTQEETDTYVTFPSRYEACVKCGSHRHDDWRLLSAWFHSAACHWLFITECWRLEIYLPKPRLSTLHVVTNNSHRC